MEDPQALENDFIYEMSYPNGKTAKLVRSCVHSETMGLPDFNRGPMLGEHSVESPRELGYGEDRIEAMRGESFTIKQLEKTRRSLEARMEKLQAAERKDDVITFEQLGVDRLFVDEAHSFKNLAKRCAKLTSTYVPTLPKTGY